MKKLQELIPSKQYDLLDKKLSETPALATHKTEQGISLLQLAAYYRDPEAVRIIRKYHTNLTIFEVASIGDFAAVQQQLDVEPSLIHEYAVDGFTVLGLSAFFGHLNIAQMLLEQGADPNVAANNDFKVTPLHSACATSDKAMAELLLQHGANVNARQMRGITPLHSAAHNGSLELVELLLTNGADVNALTEDGKTPLIMAKEAEHPSVIDYLLALNGT